MAYSTNLIIVVAKIRALMRTTIELISLPSQTRAAAALRLSIATSMIVTASQVCAVLTSFGSGKRSPQIARRTRSRILLLNIAYLLRA